MFELFLFAIDPFDKVTDYWWLILSSWLLIQGTYFFVRLLMVENRVQADSWVTVLKIYAQNCAIAVVLIMFWFLTYGNSNRRNSDYFVSIAGLIQYLPPIIIPAIIGTFIGLSTNRTKRTQQEVLDRKDKKREGVENL